MLVGVTDTTLALVIATYVDAGGVGVLLAVCPAANGVVLAQVYDVASDAETLVSMLVKLALEP